MQDLGFKAQSSIDFSQFLVLILLLVFLAGVSLFLKHKSNNGRAWLKGRSFKASSTTRPQQCGYRVQCLDKQTYLQEITSGNMIYLVLKSDSNLVLLDKISISQNRESVGNDTTKNHQKPLENDGLGKCE